MKKSYLSFLIAFKRSSAHALLATAFLSLLSPLSPLFPLLVLTTITACVPTKEKPKELPTISTTIQTLPFKPIVAETTLSKAKVAEALSRLTFDNLNRESLWALSECECASGFTAAWLRNMAISHGALPQVLVPAVREQIRNDPKLQGLAKLGKIGDLLKDLFATDEKIGAQIRTGIGEKLSKFTPGGSGLAAKIGFQFDAFVRPFGIVGADQRPDRFDFDDQVARWYSIMSLPNLWEGRAPAGLGDHGLQVLGTMQTMSDLQYFYGLAVNSTGGFYGGLTVDPRNATGAVGRFDPRTQPDDPRTGNGIFVVAFPQNSAVDMATSVTENWTRGAGTVLPAADQARYWMLGARLFQRLRPEARGAVGTLFGAPETALFPTDAHGIGLIALPSLQWLLKNAYIEKESRQFLNAHTLGQIKAQKIEEGGASAEPITAIRVGRAVLAWNEQLKTLATAGLPPDTVAKLSTAPAALLPAVQFMNYKLLRDHIFFDGTVDNKISLRVNAGTSIKTIADVAEILASWAKAESVTLQSEFVRERLYALLHWFVGEYIPASLASGQLTPQDVFWLKMMTKAFLQYPQDKLQAPWLVALDATLTAAIAEWDGRSAP